MVHVALRYGERPEVAYVLPISVDGMLIVASAAMVEDKRNGNRVRWSARIAFASGVAASVAANIAAAQPTIGARIVAAWPAVAMLLVVEMPAPNHRPVPRTPHHWATTQTSALTSPYPFPSTNYPFRWPSRRPIPSRREVRLQTTVCRRMRHTAIADATVRVRQRTLSQGCWRNVPTRAPRTSPPRPA
ncbi:DUF2637 domain-containing protein [Dactylosporangium roseum]|uniref:DUF2637 domain-containing protein n=1 Tax=Dactylosporangium roseum TaxID=47989 RepID=UPI0021B19F47